MSMIRIGSTDIGYFIEQPLRDRSHGLSIEEQESELPSFRWYHHGRFCGPALHQIPDKSGQNKGTFGWVVGHWNQDQLVDRSPIPLNDLEATLLRILTSSQDPLTYSGASIIWGLCTGSRPYPFTRIIPSDHAEGYEEEYIEEEYFGDLFGQPPCPYPRYEMMPRQINFWNDQDQIIDPMILYSFEDPWLRHDRLKLVYFCLALECDSPILEALSIAFKNPFAVPIVDNRSTIM